MKFWLVLKLEISSRVLMSILKDFGLFLEDLLGLASTGTRDYRIGSNFWKFYLIRTGFRFGELVCLVKVFRLFRLEWIVLGVQTMDTGGRCTNILSLAGPACLWCLVEDYIFAMVKYLSFHNSSSFALKILLNVNGKATVWHTSCWHRTQTQSKLQHQVLEY